ncbi:hypothetical protein EWM64_g7459 [Hericium alpestre]|uniref:Uncharacterized protein n=1 Tax=Hericium alpestre TaxID=135208 RepID=A0A4Y9ZQQ3_9AGAM|nr:hypothetical protein EWM64_g7459 [Hericium alpestre]
MPATSSNNPSSMFVDNSWYPSAQGTSSGRMPEISAPAPQSLAHAPRWPAASSSSSSWNLPLPGPSPQRPPLPSRHATPRPHAPPPPPAVPSLPYPQVSQAGASGPSSLQPAGPSTSNLRAKATLKPRKSAKDSKKGPSSGYMHKYRLNPIPRIMSSLKTKSGSVLTSGAYRDADDIESDDDGMDHGKMDDGGSMMNAEPSAKATRREKDKQRGTRHRGQIRGLMLHLHRLLWPERAVSEDEGLPHTNAQCLEKAIEWVGDSVPNAIWQQKEAALESQVRKYRDLARHFQGEAQHSNDKRLVSAQGSS